MAIGPQKVQIRRTSTANNPPTGLSPGELAIEMAEPARLWVGVPAALDPTERKLLTYKAVISSDTAPMSPIKDQIWFESDTGNLWIWYVDVDSGQWVQLNNNALSAVDPDTASDIVFEPGGGLSADDVQEALLELDNEKVAKAGDTMLGPLVLTGEVFTDLHAIHKGYVDAADAAIQAQLGDTIGEAPLDGKVYGRKDGIWYVVAAEEGGPIGNAVDVSFSPAGAVQAGNVQLAIQELDTEKVSKEGDTMSGALRIAPTIGNAQLWLNAPAGSQPVVIGQINSAVKWAELLGDNYLLQSYNDSGTVAKNVLAFDRTTGLGVLTGDPTVALGIATKQYVDSGGTSKVAKAGDTMTGALIVTPKGSMFGSPAGTSAAGAVTPADANIKLYDYGSGNWAGIGTDTSGQMWLRTGGSGTPAPGMYLDQSQFVHIAKTPTAADHAARKDYVDSAASAALGSKVSKSGDTMTGRLVNNSSTGGIGSGGGSEGAFEVQASSGAAKIAFHRTGAYAAYLGLDTDNQWAVGGWSMGAVRYKLWHEGNLNPASYYPTSGGTINGNMYATGSVESGAHVRAGNGYFYAGWGGHHFFFDGANWQSPHGNWYIGGYWVAREGLNATFSELYANSNVHSRGGHYFLAGDVSWIRWRAELSKVDTSHDWIIPNIETNVLTSSHHVYSRCGYTCKDGENSGSYTFNITWGTGVPGGTLFIGDVNVGNTLGVSDYRIKENVAPLPSLWAQVKALKPIKYTIKEYTPASMRETAEKEGKPFYAADARENWGFVAHELQETLIESVASGTKDAPNVLQSPNTLPLLAAVVKALQEAMARIEALEATR